MNKFLAFGLVLTSVGFGRSIMPQVRVSEPVRLTNVHQSLNYMPPVRPFNPLTILTVDVLSNGCTKDSDFQVQVQTRGQKQTLRVVRIRPDLCEATPHVESVRIDARGIFPEAELYVSNPVLIDVRKVY